MITSTDQDTDTVDARDTTEQDRFQAYMSRILHERGEVIMGERDENHTSWCAGCPGCWPERQEQMDSDARFYAELEAQEEGEENDLVNSYDPRDGGR